MSERTPGPWRFAPNQWEIWSEKANRSIAMLLDADALANAAFIVKAANNHDSLIEALRPLSSLIVPKRTQNNAGAYSIRFSDIERACSAMEAIRD